MTFAVALLAAAGLLLFVTGLPIARRDSLRDRVEPFLGGYGGRPSRLLGTTEARTRIPRWATVTIGRVMPIGSQALPSRLQASGVSTTVDAYRLEQVIWGFAGAIAGAALLILARVFSSVDLRALPALMVVAFLTGFLARDWWLSQQVDQRRARLAGELPAAIDLVTLSVMAGESVPSACARVARSLPSGIGAEFDRVVADVRSGTPIVEALEMMSTRIPDPAISRFMDALCTGIEKGAPLADTLRAQSEDAREARRRRLLELGGRREIAMLVPVVFLVMPTVVVFALYPGLVSLDLLVL